MTLLGALLTLAPRPLYGHVASHALDDQRLGGLMMLMGGGTVYLLGALFLASRLLRSSERTGR
jgi:putative membrane protein